MRCTSGSSPSTWSMDRSSVPTGNMPTKSGPKECGASLSLAPHSLGPLADRTGRKEGSAMSFQKRTRLGLVAAWATCQDPARAFTDGRPASVGIQGRTGQRNAPTVLNALFNKTQFWDGRAKTLEEQAALPIINEVEMGQPKLDAAVAKIADI